jgi:hypothetical protein
MKLPLWLYGLPTGSFVGIPITPNSRFQATEAVNDMGIIEPKINLYVWQKDKNIQQAGFPDGHPL